MISYKEVSLSPGVINYSMLSYNLLLRAVVFFLLLSITCGKMLQVEFIQDMFYVLRET